MSKRDYRNTSASRRHYSGVHMQQGRVQTDTDAQENQSGFRISIRRGGLRIGAGALSVDGLVARNLLDGLSYDSQPNGSARPDSLATLQTPYALAYLDVWERARASLEDPDLTDSALGGPDMEARAPLWCVGVLPVAGSESEAPTCDANREWSALLAHLKGGPQLRGYPAAKNALYRIEVHVGGGLGSGSFTWSRTDAANRPSSVVPITGEWIPLEDGVEVRFANADYKDGDSWLIPARTAEGDIEPLPSEPPRPPQPRARPRHHYKRLALLRRERRGWKVWADCRRA